MAKRLGHGRGLDAIFLDNETEGQQDVTTLRISQIEPNPNQPRRTFEEASLQQLADSIAIHGVIQPIAVRRGKNEGFYEIIAGERRWRAAKLAGIVTIPAVILELEAAAAAQAALIENIQREDLNPVEEAKAYQTLLDTYGMTQENLAKQLGKSRSQITNMLRLLDLDEAILQALATGAFTIGHAKALLSVKDPADRLALAKQIIAQGDFSVRAAEAAAAKYNRARAQQNVQNDADTAENKQDAPTQTATYFRALEQRMSQALGNRVHISRTADQKTGETRGKLEVTFSGDTQLESFIKRLCGNDFFDETTDRR